jgi:hypothetical protein
MSDREGEEPGLGSVFPRFGDPSRFRVVWGYDIAMVRFELGPNVT